MTRHKPRPRSRRTSRGIALISVLWVLTLLAVITASFTTTTRTDVNLARNLVENAEAEALAEAGVARAVAGLLASVERGGLRSDGSIYRWPFGDGEVRFSIEDEGGRVDLNGAQEDLLKALLRAVGVDSSESGELAAAIADFRDPNDERRPLGAEDIDYRDVEFEYDAKDAPFEDVGELRQVLGMTPEIFAALLPAVTVHSGQRKPNLETAPAVVKRAYNLLDDESVDQAGEDGEPGGEGSDLADQLAELEGDAAEAGELADQEPGGSEAPTSLIEGDSEARSKLGVYRIHAEARSAKGATAAIQVILRLSGGRGEPFRVLDWSQAERRYFPLAEASNQAADP